MVARRPTRAGGAPPRLPAATLVLAGGLAGLVGCRSPRAAPGDAPRALPGVAQEPVEPVPAGQEEPPGPQEGRPDEELDEEPQQEPDRLVIDTVQRQVTRGVQLSAAWIDGFLADERSLAEGNDSWVLLRLESFLEDREGLDVNAGVSGRLVLPGAKERFHLVLQGSGGQDPAEEAFAEGLLSDDVVPEESVVGPSPDQDEEEEALTAALQYLLKTTRNNNIRAEAGVRFSGLDPDPYLGARWRHSSPLGPAWALRAHQHVRAYVERGWESRTALDFERPVTERLFFRATSRANAFEAREGLFWGQDLTLFQQLASRRMLSYQVRSSFVTEPEDALDHALLRVRYSQRVLRRWILFEVAAQVAWRERDDYAPAGGLLVGFEVDFGRRR